ncbi:hypothetical protein, partial [Oceanobacillus sp. J11TS1]|uniref:hypothetical protein n=1 Tax=Oceanobacillus sp. J11TS1 TaxID=2807191 RepID=UPI001BB3A283
MKQQILDAALCILLAAAIMSNIYMALTIKYERDAYDELYHDYMQLHDDYAQIKTSYDALLDKTWQEHNRQMMEGEGE